MDCFYDRVERDELLSPYFPGGVSEDAPSARRHLMVGVLGGPARYTQELGGYEKMLAHHRGLAIAPEERHRFVSLLSSFAADDAGLPDDPEFRSALGRPSRSCLAPPSGVRWGCSKVSSVRSAASRKHA